MKKGTSIVLLSIISFIMAFLMVMTFVRFPVGVKQYNSVLGAIELDHGISSSAVYTLSLDKTSDIPEDMDEVLSTLDYRLNELGYTNHTLQAVKPVDSNVYDIRVEVNPDINDSYEIDTDTLDTVMDKVIKYGSLKFYGGSSSNPTTEIFKDIENPVAKAEFAGYNEQVQYYICNITFSSDAMAELEELMSEGDFYMLVKLGDEALNPFNGTSAITLDYFSGSTIAIQSMDEISSKLMALQITSGGLDYKYTRSTVSVASAYLGSSTATVITIVMGVALVIAMVALILINKGFGIASALSLLAFAILQTIMMIAVPGIKFSIGGIIGFALATVLAIDGMVVTSKRINEELASGKTVKSALRTGFNRALMPNLGAGIVSIFISLLLFAFTKAEVQVFGIVFGIGSALALITSLVFVRMFNALLLPLVNDKEKFLKTNKEAK